MKSRLIAIIMMLAIIISSCSSGSSQVVSSVQETGSSLKTEEKEADVVRESKKDEQAGGIETTKTITYFELGLTVPEGWLDKKNDDDSMMIARSTGDNFVCCLDAYNITENVDENTTEEDIYPLCKQLVQDDEVEMHFENGHFLECPAVYFDGWFTVDDGSETDIEGVSFAADKTIYIFYFMTFSDETREEDKQICRKIQDTITIKPGVDTGVYAARSSQNNQGKTKEENKDTDNTKDKDPIPTAASNRDMKLGDIGKVNDVYAGLSYVKRMNALPTGLGDYEEEIGEGNECILAFFDFYNSSGNSVVIHPEEITCYADGVQVEDVDNTFNVECDGIKQYYYPEIEGKAQLISVQDFEVPSGWSELKFFYESKCVWTVTPEDVQEDDFEFKSMYSLDIEREPTKEDTVIYQGDYEIIFKGVTDYTYENSVYGDEPYIVFKFTINNTGDAPIDYSFAGYNMTAYQDNYYIDTASYNLDDKVDGYSNIYNIDKIEAGMSANIYVAFDASVTNGDLYMVYDDGYVSNNRKGTVFVER